MTDLNENGSNGRQTENKGTGISPFHAMCLRSPNTGFQGFPFGTTSWPAMYRGPTVKSITLRTRNAKVQASILCLPSFVNEHLKITMNPICKTFNVYYIHRIYMMTGETYTFISSD
jgi:hypothetical protein